MGKISHRNEDIQIESKRIRKPTPSKKVYLLEYHLMVRIKGP